MHVVIRRRKELFLTLSPRAGYLALLYARLGSLEAGS